MYDLEAPPQSMFDKDAPQIVLAASDVKVEPRSSGYTPSTPYKGYTRTRPLEPCGQAARDAVQAIKAPKPFHAYNMGMPLKALAKIQVSVSLSCGLL